MFERWSTKVQCSDRKYESNSKCNIVKITAPTTMVRIKSLPKEATISAQTAKATRC